MLLNPLEYWGDIQLHILHLKLKKVDPHFCFYYDLYARRNACFSILAVLT